MLVPEGSNCSNPTLTQCEWEQQHPFEAPARP